jgi:succinyl-diaminopimelate desuccinylase
MKGGVAALVAAAAHFASRNPDAPISVVLSANEEIGCDGVKKLLDGDCLERPRCILVAEPTANVPCLGHKGVFWLKVVFHGKTAHAAFPSLGENALVKAAKAVVDLNNDIPRAAPHPVMGELTLVTSRFLSGDNYNSVPDHAEIGIDIRSTVNKSNKAIYRDVQSILAPYKSEIEIIFDLPPLWTEPEADTIPEIFSCCDNIRRQKHPHQVITFYTDGGILGPGLNAPVVILGPGDPDMAHTVDESINISDLDEGVDIYLEILSQLC